MKVNRAGHTRSAVTRRVGTGRSSGSSTEFRLAATEGGAPASGASGVAPTGAIGGLLSLQEVPATDAERRRALSRGRDLLAELDGIRVGLLAGRLPRRRIERILVLLRERRGEFGDPRLDEIIGEIELRAAVELAKIEATEASLR